MSPEIEVIARGLVVADSRVLLCISNRGGYAYLPGGHVHFGEPAAESLRREFREETGLDVVIGPLLAVAEVAFKQVGMLRHEVNLVFHVEPWSSDVLSSVSSREPEIEFEWSSSADFSGRRIYPEIIRSWLLKRLHFSARIAHPPPEAHTDPLFLSSIDSA